MTDQNDFYIFSTLEYQELGHQLAQRLSINSGVMETKCFPDGERYLRLKSRVRQSNVICVGGMSDDRSTLDLYDLASAVVDQGARRLTMVVPYFGYSTMERATLRGEAVVAKYRARLLSSIPHATARNIVLFFDLHSPGIPHYMENGVSAIHVRSFDLLAPHIKRLGGEDFVLGSTDAGRAKWVETMANMIGVEAAFILKRRRQDGGTEVLALNASVDGRTVVIYDDMVRSGGSLISAAKAYHQAGATRLIAVTTHGLFSDNAIERLRASGLFASILCTDSHPNSRLRADGFVQRISCAPAFAAEIQTLIS
ncbi:MAG: ribose-phosphate diphosphokinase [Bradymonadia bacterium]